MIYLKLLWTFFKIGLFTIGGGYAMIPMMKSEVVGVGWLTEGELLDFMAISSYGSATKTSGVVRILKDLDNDILGKDVIVVEDIVDSGITLSYLTKILMQRGAKSLKVAALLDKPARRKVPDLKVDYMCFDIPDAFVVGYGLDYDQTYRNLPDIGILSPRIYDRK